ncbi:LacI family DNA-binding transcriptional regulator [Cellulomonas bogoriensis]|uniref:LacI family transcriptional regulator n=1 Tax=Cellulomonas bogoriensis 69B4 = DSM 16987 TaxID=1386082 RepID=A0A0A0BRC0_9CELL|nr:LacI family DNA-binding transcriptional regulator [Cellulomonas bogoriensis]KGM11018.1 LacI family transcriptional regulator [Cellulomonas bogoriensis 69B4 = DSM 16987]
MTAQVPRTRTSPGGAGYAPTLEEVAERAGVSRSTASRAINGGLKVSPEAQAAVDSAVQELGYTPNRAARTLVTRRTDSVALVVPEPDETVLTDPYFAGTLQGLTAALSTTELQLVLLIARRGEETQRTARYLRNQHVDGAVIVSHHRDDALEQVLSSSQLPCVFVGRPWGTPEGLQYVDVDNYLGGRRATEYLVSVGCTKIGTIAGPLDMAAGVDRLAGWRQALQDAHLSDEAMVRGDFTSSGGAAAMERLLAAHPDLDGVFAASDLMAAGALDVLQAHGRSVPEDVRLIGFDNLGVAVSTKPHLTTMNNPVVEMSRIAGELLLDQISGGASSTEPRIFGAEVVVRASA